MRIRSGSGRGLEDIVLILRKFYCRNTVGLFYLARRRRRVTQRKSENSCKACFSSLLFPFGTGMIGFSTIPYISTRKISFLDAVICVLTFDRQASVSC